MTIQECKPWNYHTDTRKPSHRRAFIYCSLETCQTWHGTHQKLRHPLLALLVCECRRNIFCTTLTVRRPVLEERLHNLGSLHRWQSRADVGHSFQTFASLLPTNDKCILDNTLELCIVWRHTDERIGNRCLIRRRQTIEGDEENRGGIQCPQ
jgi:hypothetical protein